MVDVFRRKRKPPVLTPSAIPCLNRLPTINITQGCALGCTYCYIQGYSHYPGPDRVILFENTPELLNEELLRKRRIPRRVYFSPSSDAFQYPPEVQDISLRTMTILLEAGIQVAFLTKGFVTRRFVELFRAHADSVFAQMGISTLDRKLWQALEPRAASPQHRMATIGELRDMGVAVTARLDPLLPDVTDTPMSLEPLLSELRNADVTDASASYLFLRPALARNVETQLARLGVARARIAAWEHTDFLGGCSGGRMLNRGERKLRFDTLCAMGLSYGITISVCRCKNPDLASTGCGIAGPGLAGKPPERDRPHDRAASQNAIAPADARCHVERLEDGLLFEA